MICWKKEIHIITLLIIYLLCSGILRAEDNKGKNFDVATGFGCSLNFYQFKSDKESLTDFDINGGSSVAGVQICYQNYGVKLYAYPGLYLDAMANYALFYVRGNYYNCQKNSYGILSADTDSQKVTKEQYADKELSQNSFQHFETEVGAVLSFEYNQNPYFNFKNLDYFSMLYTSHSKQSLGIVFSTKYYYDSLSCSDGLIPETERDNYSVVGGLQSVDSHSVRINAMPMAQIYWVSLGIGLGMTSQIGYFDIGSKRIHKTNSGFGVNSIFFKIAPSSDSLYLSLILNYEGNAAYKLERDVTLGKSSYFVEAKVGYRF